MCPKNKSIIAILCAITIILGGASVSASVPTGADTTANSVDLIPPVSKLEQLQQIINMLQQQIQQLIVLVQQKIQVLQQTAANCAKEGETINISGIKECCEGLYADPGCTNCLADSWICRRAVCGNSTCETGETAATCPPDCGGSTAPSSITCSSDQDCVSDSGTCHQCFNKTFWNALSVDRKKQYLCFGIGDALCKCQNGNCVVSSICGDGTCDTTKGETAATCPKDCGAIKICYSEGGGLLGITNGTSSSLSCCPGLTQISRSSYANYDCSVASTTEGFLCTYCGNGKCGVGENKCNCPADCGKSTSCKKEGELFGYFEGDCCAGLLKVYPEGAKTYQTGESQNFQVTCQKP